MIAPLPESITIILEKIFGCYNFNELPPNKQKEAIQRIIKSVTNARKCRKNIGVDNDWWHISAGNIFKMTQILKDCQSWLTEYNKTNTDISWTSIYEEFNKENQ